MLLFKVRICGHLQPIRLMELRLLQSSAAGQIDSEAAASQIIVKPSAEIIFVNLSAVIPLQSQTQLILKTERKSLLIPMSNKAGWSKCAPQTFCLTALFH